MKPSPDWEERLFLGIFLHFFWALCLPWTIYLEYFLKYCFKYQNVFLTQISHLNLTQKSKLQVFLHFVFQLYLNLE